MAARVSYRVERHDFRLHTSRTYKLRENIAGERDVRDTRLNEMQDLFIRSINLLID